jgi:hypothetical protein
MQLLSFNASIARPRDESADWYVLDWWCSAAGGVSLISSRSLRDKVRGAQGEPGRVDRIEEVETEGGEEEEEEDVKDGDPPTITKTETKTTTTRTASTMRTTTRRTTRRTMNTFVS